MADSILSDKSLQFALHIVNTYKQLCANNEYVMSKQLLRSGTSIGSNIAEANMAQSKADFSAKMYIALKEANESLYWIKLLSLSSYLDADTAEKLNRECRELLKMLIATTKKTAPRN